MGSFCQHVVQTMVVVQDLLALIRAGMGHFGDEVLKSFSFKEHFTHAPINRPNKSTGSLSWIRTKLFLCPVDALSYPEWPGEFLLLSLGKPTQQ